MELKEYIKEKGMTHQQLADATGYCRVYVTQVLNGRRPSYDFAVALSKATGGKVSIERLMQREAA